MPQTEITDVASGDELKIVPKDTTELQIEQDCDITTNDKSTKQDINIDEKQESIAKLEDDLKLLNINLPKDLEHPLPVRESSAQVIPQDIVIQPVEVRPDKNERDPIVLIAGSGREIRPRIGIYSIEGHYLRPAKINKWVMVILFDKLAVEELTRGKYSFDDIRIFSERYVFVGQSKGVQVQPMSSIQCIPKNATIERNVETMAVDDLKKELRELFVGLNNSLVDHAIFILPDNCPPWVHGLLQYFETCTSDSNERLTRTSRIRYKTLIELGIKSNNGNSKMLIPHLWLKYNTKLGGINVAFKRTFENHQMSFLNESHLIIAIDLYYTYHSDEEANVPPISVVVGMWDLASSKMSFHTETRAQVKTAVNPSEMAVTDLDQMIKQVILSFKQRKNNRIPSRMIVFRSGTYKSSDNGIAMQEIAKIKQALEEEISEDNPMAPALTYLKVPKKERVRKYDNHGNGRNNETACGNDIKSSRRPGGTVQTGSLVNSIIASQTPAETAANEPQPNLISNNSFDRPRSNVFKLYDEANLSTAAIQTMVNALSYLSPRVTARTRPTPIDLADLAGERTHNIVKALMDDLGVQPDDSKLIERVNEHLSAKLGCADYKSYLYYA